MRIRDPFIVPVPVEHRYYLYGSTHLTPEAGLGFDAYRSSDLINWEGPFPVFRPPVGFWSDRDPWAPEVHVYNGRYYMFASFKSATVCRCTQILVADQPEGPFRPHSNLPVTPPDWECLDGTFYLDNQNQPWIVFCHEWIQIDNGEICARKLKGSLDEPVSDPVLLFKAGDPRWVVSLDKNKPKYVTDGPFLHRLLTGELVMLWSSFSTTGYVLAQAKSSSGTILGPWQHADDLIFTGDGGHGMIFRTFENKLMLSIHAPNCGPNERPKLLPIQEQGGWIKLL